MKWYILAIQKYADFTGRASRSQYWWFIGINFLIWCACALIDSLVGFFNLDLGIGLLSGLYALVMVIPSLSAGTRRLHDTDRSGWWLLLGFVPIISLVLLVFMLLKSQPGANRFGESPWVNKTPGTDIPA